MSRSSARRWRPILEALEERCTPATFTVSNLNDSGVDSLRAAVDAANTRPGLDKIVFASGLAGTLRLTSGEIAIREDVKITGPGAQKLALSGNLSSRVFNIDDASASTARSVTIKKLEFRHGRAGADGGAIFCMENLKLVSTFFTQNQSSLFGGAIACTGNLTVKDSTLSGNLAAGGGAIVCSAIATISGSTISANTAAIGGGIRCITATISDSTISGNTAVVSGGGIDGDTVIISGSTISGNAAGIGGGIDGATVTISGSTVSGNRAEADGGGINCSDAATITSSTIAFNQATNRDGGGLRILGTEPSLVLNSTISSNLAAEDGGGIWSNSTSLKVHNSTIAFNRAFQFGGGMFLEGATVFLKSSLIADNGATGTDKDIENGAGGVFELMRCLVGIHGDAAIVDLIGNLFGTSASPMEPRLAPLASNGGSTLTHALKKGSPAIDQGDISGGLTTDQRGGEFLRSVGGGVDIGAFERQ